MRILLITLNWYPYSGPLIPIYASIIRRLMQKGHKVTILTSFPHFRRGHPETWKEYRGKLYEKTTWEGAILVRSYVCSPIHSSERFSLVYRALNILSFTISSIITGILVTGKQDVILTPSPPLTNGLCAGMIGFFKRIPFICNVQDIHPDVAIKTGVVKNRFLIRVLRIFESIFYKKARKIVVISEAMRNNLIGKKVECAKIDMIPNFVDTDLIRPMNKENEFSSRHGLDRKFVVLYAGNIGFHYGIEFVLAAAGKLKMHTDIIFAFVSRGEYRDRMMSLAKSKNLKNVVFPMFQPENMIPLVLATADVSLITMKKGLSTESVPSKTYAIMASGRPVIAMIDEKCELWQMIEQAECGLCVPPENPELLMNAVLDIYRNPKKRKKMGLDGRRYVSENFRKEKIADKFESLILSLRGNE